MKWQLCVSALTISCLLGGPQWHSAAADPWADQVISYVPGSNPVDGYTEPSTSAGPPERFTGEVGEFPGTVTPFSSPWGTDEIVSIGEGGELVVRFDEPITDELGNPFGVDLLVFGNALYSLDSDTLLATGTIDSEAGVIEVSADGITYVAVPGVDADGAFPTLGYQDVTEPFPANPGSVLTDFTRPVDPAFDPTDMDIVQIAAAYDRSGGGAGVDLATVGLSAISYVRITNPVGSGVTPEIDALVDVRAIPEPATWLLALLGIGVAVPRPRRARAACDR